MPCWRMPWQNNIGPIGLDLGADTPRAMQVRLGVDEPRIRTTARIEPAADLVERARAAANAMRRERFVGREVVVGLPSPFARMHVARLPALVGNDLHEAVAWEASERSAMPRETIVADSVPTGAPQAGTDGREEQLVVSANIVELEAALDVLIDAGFEPISVEPRFAAIARALGRRTRRDADLTNIRAVLHIENFGSTVLVLRGDRIAFCREIALGGDALDHAVSTRLAIPLGSASVLRARRIAAIRGVAPTVDAVAEEAALAATRPTIDAIAGELALCLRYFGVTFRGGQPSRVILSGPHSFEPRLAGIIEETCRASVGAFEAELPTATATDANFQREGAATWIAAYGLSCRGRDSRGNGVAA